MFAYCEENCGYETKDFESLEEIEKQVIKDGGKFTYSPSGYYGQCKCGGLLKID